MTRCLLWAVKVKAHELREKGRDELLRQLDELKTELQQLRVAKVTGGAASKLSKMLASSRPVPLPLSLLPGGATARGNGRIHLLRRHARVAEEEAPAAYTSEQLACFFFREQTFTFFLWWFSRGG